MLDNNWSDEARAASLAVRQAKAQQRQSGNGSDSDSGSGPDDGDSGSDPDVEGIREKLRDGEPLSPEEESHLEDLMESGYAGESDSDPVFDWMERRSQEDSGRGGGEPDSGVEDDDEMGRRMDEHAERLRRRRENGESLSDAEENFLSRYQGLLENRRGRDPAGDSVVRAVARAKLERSFHAFG